MNSAISQIKTAPQVCVSASKLGFSSPPPLSTVCLPMKKRWRIMECAKEECGAGIDGINKEEEELMGIMKRSEKCRETGGGIVELMECLEREAIMGEDEGREATDYNRRALIFDKSARVFHALKQATSSSSPP